MKRTILASAFILFFLSQLRAHSGDTIRVNHRLSLPYTIERDSLSFRKNENISPFLSIPTKGQNLLFSEREDKMTMKYETKKRSLFNSSYTKFIIPTALISYGLIARGNESLLNLDHSTNNEVGEHFPKRVSFDDYLQYAPTASVYGLDLIGMKAKHNFRDRTLILATSYLVMGATVQTMKRSFGVKRPDESNSHSFPSGHTATAFVGAHILFKEYKDVSPWIGIGGYAVASATGTMRILNKKHWISDVVTGAGIGILSAEVGYMLLPVWHNLLGIKNRDKSLVIAPVVSAENAGLGLAYTF